jgi:hypothetical protein
MVDVSPRRVRCVRVHPPSDAPPAVSGNAPAGSTAASLPGAGDSVDDSAA